jgi:hypothetical protein
LGRRGEGGSTRPDQEREGLWSSRRGTTAGRSREGPAKQCVLRKFEKQSIERGCLGCGPAAEKAVGLWPSKAGTRRFLERNSALPGRCNGSNCLAVTTNDHVGKTHSQSAIHPSSILHIVLAVRVVKHPL